MKDKKTLITIIVLLVIFLPIGLFGTIKSFSTTKSDVKDDNPIKSLNITINYTFTIMISCYLHMNVVHVH